MNVLHIITGLNTGGAEMMLYKLLSGMDRQRFQSVVVSLTDKGTLGERIEAIDVPVHALGMKPGQIPVAGFWHLVKLLRELKPDILQGWMYHGNLAAQVAAFFVPGNIPVLWNVRQSLYSLDYEKRGTAAVIKMGRYISKYPEYIIYNSKTSADQHEAIGYCKDKRIVIPNGFDTELFAPSDEAKKAVRAELNIPDDAILIGLIGRYHPMKDHPNFLKAASIALKSHSGLHFILAGAQVDSANEHLRKMISDLNILERMHLLGERSDIPRITAALDVASSSSSWGEGFPNVVGEAMACCVPCVVTDVGDSALIIGDTGLVVTPRNSPALANAWKELIEMGTEKRKELGRKARQRIIENFSLDAVVKQYEKLYSESHLE